MDDMAVKCEKDFDRGLVEEAVALLELDRAEREARAQAKIRRALAEEDCRMEYSITIASTGAMLPGMRIVANGAR